MRQSWWSQWRPAAQPPGQGSTMATSCLSTKEDMHQLLNVLMKIKSLSLVVQHTHWVLYSSMLKPAVMACLVLPTMPRKNLLVLSHKVLRLTSSSATGVDNQWFGSLPRLNYWTQVWPQCTSKISSLYISWSCSAPLKNSSILNLRTKMSFSL